MSKISEAIFFLHTRYEKVSCMEKTTLQYSLFLSHNLLTNNLKTFYNKNLFESFFLEVLFKNNSLKTKVSGPEKRIIEKFLQAMIFQLQ